MNIDKKESKIISYTDSFELLLKEEGEKAESLSILHHIAYKKCNKLSIITNIPVIVLSALVGFLSPIDLFYQQNIFLGALSVIISIIKTIDSYMDFTKLTQTHYLTSLNYKKISKFIQIQLSLEKECRINPADLLSVITNDLNNISDSEPCIPGFIIKKYNRKYNTSTATKPPMCCDKLTDIKINKTSFNNHTTQTDLIKIDIKNLIKYDTKIDIKDDTKIDIKDDTKEDSKDLIKIKDLNNLNITNTNNKIKSNTNKQTPNKQISNKL
jgi:hypothetical protein